MAKDITGNPWILDTAEVIVTTPLRVKAMEWRPETAAGDDLSVTDNGGSEVWTEKAIAVDASGMIAYLWAAGMGDPVTVNGLTVATIDSGTLRVWVV